MLYKIPKTEMLNKKTEAIDKLSVKQALKVLVKDQQKSLKVIKKIIDEIEVVVDRIYKHLKKSNGGRIIYCGAGTSGRIGVQDGVELYPTFGWPTKRVDFILAGGLKALTKSVENAEDDIISPEKIVQDLKIDDFSKECMEITEKELLEEKAAIEHLL